MRLLLGAHRCHSVVCTDHHRHAMNLHHSCLCLSHALPFYRCGLSDDKPFPLSPQEEMHNNVEVVHTYRQHILNDMNPSNLHLFISAYNRQEPLGRGGRGHV